ncbi:MAG: GNAT family N-acetyltransferase [Candidatus Limnocylindrales bacterium]
MASTTLSPNHLAVSAAGLIARPVAFADIPRATWDRLLARTASQTPFSRWTFHRAWWDAYGETAHEQYLVVGPAAAGDDFDAAIAIVPLMHRHEIEPDDAECRTSVRPHEPTGTTVPGEAKAVFFGASYHADYATILADPANLPAVATAIADSFAQPPDSAHGSKDWDVVDLRRLRGADPVLAALEAALGKTGERVGWRVVRELEDVCPVFTAPSADWDEYLATLDKKARHEIRRKLRRAAEVGALTVEIVAPTVEAVDAFIELHRARFGEEGLFPNNPGGERSRTFIHRLAELERELGDDERQLQVGLVRCSGRLVFTMLAFDDGQTCFLYNAGMDPEAREVSPGVSGAALYFQDRMAAGRRRFDFLRGNEPYKYEWGAVDEPIERLLVTRP